MRQETRLGDKDCGKKDGRDDKDWAKTMTTKIRKLRLSDKFENRINLSQECDDLVCYDWANTLCGKTGLYS